MNLFARFLKQWLQIHQKDFQIGFENLFNMEDLLKYIDDNKTQQPELLTLCISFLGSHKKLELGFLRH